MQAYNATALSSVTVVDFVLYRSGLKLDPAMVRVSVTSGIRLAGSKLWAGPGRILSTPYVQRTVKVVY